MTPPREMPGGAFLSESSDSAVAAMEARRAKCRRLLAGSHLLGTETSNLAGVLKRLRTLPEEDKALLLELGSARKTLTHAMEDIMRHTRQLVQVPATRGGTQTLEFLSVFKLWDYLLTQNVAGYTKLLLALPRSRGPARECALRSAPRPARPATPCPWNFQRLQLPTEGRAYGAGGRGAERSAHSRDEPRSSGAPPRTPGTWCCMPTRSRRGTSRNRIISGNHSGSTSP